MDLFERLRDEVSAEAAGRRYGLRFNRSGRAWCPFHPDGKHAAMAFYTDGGAYCHSCHMSADAVSLTAKLLNLSQIDAAKQLAHDFNITDVDGRPDPALIEKRKRECQQERERREAEKNAFNLRWGQLCEIAREADAELRRFTDPEVAWNDPRFIAVLTALARANELLDIMWEVICYERS